MPMTHCVRLSALLIAPALLAQAPEEKKWPGTPASWVDPDKGEPTGTHYKTFPSKFAAAPSALPSSEGKPDLFG